MTVVTAPNLFVITGGPGSGKTTLLNELASLGYACLPEVARQIIREQVARDGAGLPWADTSLYTQQMLERSITSFEENCSTANITFADRGIPDTLCYARLIGLPDQAFIRSACAKYRYGQRVFIAPPWKEIYETDNERKQDFEEAVGTYLEMLRVYTDCGY